MAKPLQSETLHFPNLHAPVTVIFEANGTPHIRASTNDDLFWMIGYLQARFRLTQMDLMRRQGEGRLSEILGLQALSSDELQMMLGLDRAAQRDWQALPVSIHEVLTIYTQGVNALIQEEEQSNSLPFLFKLLNYRPQPWTPIDSLVIQGELTQTGAFSTMPLDYALMVQALGYQRTMQWFPVLPPDTQHPYDTGPYRQPTGLRPLPSQLALNQDAMQTIASLDQQIRALPNATRDGSDSNDWAVNGPKTASGKALMAGDPHLQLTLPSIWYQLNASSPDYSFSGASIPGFPVSPIGRNQHISWSLTDVQNQSTFFYVEDTDRAHPHQGPAAHAPGGLPDSARPHLSSRSGHCGRDPLGGLDGRAALDRWRGVVGGTQGHELQPVPVGAKPVDRPHAELRVCRRPGEYRYDLAGLLSGC